MRKFIRFVFSRKMLIILILLVQVFTIIAAVLRLSEHFAWVYALFTLLSIIVVYVILNKSTNPAYKIAWIIPTLTLPIFGGIVYLVYSMQTSTKVFKLATLKRVSDTRDYLKQNYSITDELEKENVYVRNLAGYMNNKGGFPIYRNTTVTYFRCGEEKFEQVKAQLRRAKHFIFMEYFIIDDGKIWSEILEILKEKVKAGVDVRVLYDGMGTQMLMPDDYDKKLRRFGIKCRVFNSFKPLLSSTQNNRDHRKIMVIDGHTGFNGGINIGDEYANIKERFGYWKDTAVMLHGEAVWSFTIMFLQMWGLSEYRIKEDYSVFAPHKNHPGDFLSDGYVMPYGDIPVDGENVGELVYMDIINKARKYVYITTPYLILDNEMMVALGFAAKSGVDIKIIVPGIPDKWYVHCIAQSYYKELINLGIKIYEYTPGFIHAKSFVSDDNTAVVGTINLDYRSLYLHFECATYMYNTSCISDIKNDFMDTLSKCTMIDDEYLSRISAGKKIVNGFLRTLGPLL
ncbi:MAG: cardiolipin synthase [Oscillospiraceae bacterium]|nr:cardiolipin synthase [Oscillospiraceae bacterium]